jgi:hypothetical protein
VSEGGDLPVHQGPARAGGVGGEHPDLARANRPATRANTDSNSSAQQPTSAIPSMPGQRQPPARDTNRSDIDRKARPEPGSQNDQPGQMSDLVEQAAACAADGCSRSQSTERHHLTSAANELVQPIDELRFSCRLRAHPLQPATVVSQAPPSLRGVRNGQPGSPG